MAKYLVARAGSVQRMCLWLLLFLGYVHVPLQSYASWTISVAAHKPPLSQRAQERFLQEWFSSSGNLYWPTLVAFNDAALSAKLSEDKTKELREKLVQRNGMYRLYVTAEEFPRLPTSWQTTIRGFVIQKAQAATERTGLQLALVFNDEDDVRSIAQTFSSNRDVAPLERLLFMTLREQHDAQASIPLVAILPKIIRKHINTYSDYTGPNCHNAALAVAMDRRYQIAYQGPEGILAQLQDLEAVPVQAGEPLSFGDVMIYGDGSGVALHSSTYTASVGGRDILFTKNGLSANSPYIFQYRSDVEQIYFPHGGHVLSVFRPSQSGRGGKLHSLFAVPYESAI